VIDFSIDPVHFYIRFRGREVRHTEDFNAINKLRLTKDGYQVFLWSDAYSDYINVTDELAKINEKLGY
jgi:hypothetical protein